MFTIRKFLSAATLLVLTACSSFSSAGVPTQVEKAASKPTLTPAQPGTLEGSILAGHWKDNTEVHLLVPVDPATGQALPDYEPISLGQNYSYAFSPDRRMLAVVGYGSSLHLNGGSLHLINLETWEDHVQELRLDSYVNAMDFSPDGKQLTIAYGNAKSQIIIIDVTEPFVKSKSAVLEASMDFIVNKMSFTSDGSGLMIYGYRTENPSTVNQVNPDSPVVVLLESADLSTRWQADLESIRHGIVPKDETSDDPIDFTQPGQAIYLFPGLTFAPDSDILYVVHADEDKLTTVDFAAQEIDSVEITPELSWMERLLSLTADVAHAKVAEGTSKHVVISPDGETLYIVGLQSDLNQENSDAWQIIENPLGLQIVRTEDGKQLEHSDSEASSISISYDGRYLFLQGWSQERDSAWTQIFDTTVNQPITRIENNTWLVPTRRLNGTPVLASSVYINGESEHHYTTVDPNNLSVLAEWSSSDYLVWLTAK